MGTKEKFAERFPHGAGVYRNKVTGTWVAGITDPDGKLVDLGDFDSHEEARAEYIAASNEFYGGETKSPVDPAKHHVLSAAPIEVKH